MLKHLVVTIVTALTLTAFIAPTPALSYDAGSNGGECNATSSLSIDVKNMPLGQALDLVSKASGGTFQFEFAAPGLAHRRVSFSGTTDFVTLVLTLVSQADASPVFRNGLCRPGPGGGLIRLSPSSGDIPGRGANSVPSMDKTLSGSFHNLNSVVALSLAAEAAGVEVFYPSTLPAREISLEAKDEPWLSLLDRMAKSAGAKGATISPTGTVKINQ